MNSAFYFQIYYLRKKDNSSTLIFYKWSFLRCFLTSGIEFFIEEVSFSLQGTMFFITNNIILIEGSQFLLTGDNVLHY